MVLGFISTAFILHAGTVFKEAGYKGVIKRTQRGSWKANMNNPMIMNINDDEACARAESDYEIYVLDKKDNDRQFK